MREAARTEQGRAPAWLRLCGAPGPPCLQWGSQGLLRGRETDIRDCPVTAVLSSAETGNEHLPRSTQDVHTQVCSRVQDTHACAHVHGAHMCGRNVHTDTRVCTHVHIGSQCTCLGIRVHKLTHAHTRTDPARTRGRTSMNVQADNVSRPLLVPTASCEPLRNEHSGIPKEAGSPQERPQAPASGVAGAGPSGRGRAVQAPAQAHFPGSPCPRAALAAWADSLRPGSLACLPSFLWVLVAHHETSPDHAQQHPSCPPSRPEATSLQSCIPVGVQGPVVGRVDLQAPGPLPRGLVPAVSELWAPGSVVSGVPLVGVHGASPVWERAERAAGKGSRGQPWHWRGTSVSSGWGQAATGPWCWHWMLGSQQGWAETGLRACARARQGHSCSPRVPTQPPRLPQPRVPCSSKDDPELRLPQRGRVAS